MALKSLGVVEVEPQHQMLYDKLTRLKIEPCNIAQIIQRLAFPPLSFGSIEHEHENNGKPNIPFDDDCAARMLRLNEGASDQNATWASLTRAERKRAERLWNTQLALGASTGRPVKVDSALVLYTVRILEEAAGKRFAFSMPPLGGAPFGPMWNALMTALPLAQLHLARMHDRETEEPYPATAVAEIIKTIRLVTNGEQTRFSRWCKTLGLGISADDVASDPATFRYGISQARLGIEPPP